ncbi:hypothetical protein AAFF_G00415070 [Aldrovandia affinis]|uniref:Uncharacterized protein n=1 Tax=Aldrovandia affinis TaxID=143900 RepID=A0AAD7SB59_9TELE|nr:hypothetical protein AAFF_G00415070 [Aldrovandia affinis]
MVKGARGHRLPSSPSFIISPPAPGATPRSARMGVVQQGRGGEPLERRGALGVHCTGAATAAHLSRTRRSQPRADTAQRRRLSGTWPPRRWKRSKGGIGGFARDGAHKVTLVFLKTGTGGLLPC